jgi:hypothetical protein
VVLGGDDAAEMDGVAIAEIGDVKPEEAGDAVEATRGESGAAGGKFMHVAECEADGRPCVDVGLRPRLSDGKLGTRDKL